MRGLPHQAWLAGRACVTQSGQCLSVTQRGLRWGKKPGPCAAEGRVSLPSLAPGSCTQPYPSVRVHPSCPIVFFPPGTQRPYPATMFWKNILTFFFQPGLKHKQPRTVGIRTPGPIGSIRHRHFPREGGGGVRGELEPGSHVSEGRRGQTGLSGAEMGWPMFILLATRLSVLTQ